MKSNQEFEFSTSSERLTTLVNLLELALYAPLEEITFEGRAALQSAARQIVILSGDVLDGKAPIVS